MRMDSGFWSAKTIRACRRHQLRYSITVRQTTPIRAAIAAIDEAASTPIVYPDGGLAQVAETRYRAAALPSGKFAANAAWLVVATLAHNLLRWVAAIGLGARQELVVAKTLRRTLLALPGRLTRSARRLVLHLPAGWPWAAWFELALARLRCVAYAT
jgi:Transposase DDE domain group 1